MALVNLEPMACGRFFGRFSVSILGRSVLVPLAAGKSSTKATQPPPAAATEVAVGLPHLVASPTPSNLPHKAATKPEGAFPERNFCNSEIVIIWLIHLDHVRVVRP